MNDNEPILHVDHLSISFGKGPNKTLAVSDVTFDIIPGRTIAIVGESGSGKTVSSLSIMHLLPEGAANFEAGFFTLASSLFDNGTGAKNKVYPKDEFLKTLRGNKISMVFQEPMTSLNPVMTCGEQVSEMLREHLGLDKTEAQVKTIRLFQEVKLPRCEEIFDQYPHQLSGGQRQRVMIAMAISCEPAILIADEPTTALDVTVQKEILLLLKTIQIERKMALVFITHDLGVVAEIADDILVMKQGQVVEYGIASDVLSSPKHAYTLGLLACKPEPDKKNQRLKTVADFLGGASAKKGDVILPRLSKTSHNDTLLRVQNLRKSYSGKKGLFTKQSKEVLAVNDVSFEIFKGETLGLVGESGCGKTTLSRMLLGLIPATSGSIQYDLAQNGLIDFTSISKYELRRLRKEIQIIFQDPYSSLNPKHTIGESIQEPMRVFKLHQSDINRKKKAIELMEKVGLNETHLSRYPHEFSGGQRQRVVIARALACEPSFIICDESVSALDVSVQAQVLNLLNDLKNDFDLTYLFISHDLNVVYYMSDRIMVMNKGRVEELNTAENIFYHPESAYTKKLLDAIPGNGSLTQHHFG